MRLSHLLNPLQWNFGPRTTATLLTWAVLPVTVASLVVWRSFHAASAEAGLQPEQVTLLAQRMLSSALWVTVPLFIVAIVASVLFSVVVVKPLWRLRQGMDRVAQGDLCQPNVAVTSADEVGQITGSFNVMTVRLGEMVRTMASTASALDGAVSRLDGGAREAAQVTEASSQQIESMRHTAEQQALQVATGARAIREVEDAARQVAAAALAQANEVETAAETVRQMAAAIQQVAGGAGVVAGAAGRTRQAADDGSDAVRLSAEGMDQVRTRVHDAAEKLRLLSQSLSHVDEILRLITEIAGQTDLLALNAAIEAARVGEHGKGFAVVAGEVRRLSERSRSAAAEIASRIVSLRQGAVAVVETMEAGTQEVEQGVVLSRKAGEALERILSAVAETQCQVASISAASEQIAAASGHVVGATVQLSAIAEENAATSEQMLASARAVTQLISGVEADARNSQAATQSMAASAVQVRSSVGDMAQLAGRVATMANDLRQQAEQFRS